MAQRNMKNGTSKYHNVLKERLDPLVNQTERVIAFLGALGRFLQDEGYGIPIVVGESAKFGKEKDSLGWARVLLTLTKQNGLPLNEDLLRERAEAADVTDVLEEIWSSESPSNICVP